MMNLKNYLRIHDNDFDCYDTIYDACITVCYDSESEEPYDLFIANICAHVNVLERLSDCELLCDWTEMLMENLETFRLAAEELWYAVPKFEEELIFQWVKELHLLFAGYVSEEAYTKYNQIFSTLRRNTK